MKLQLKRPLIFFDLETTGLDILKDRIVEISMIRVEPDGKTIEQTRRLNPGMPIPEEVSKVHGIYDKDVAGEKSFAQIADRLLKFITGCDIAGFNSSKFDIPLLDEEFRRAGKKWELDKVRFVDVQTIFHKREPRNLVAAYRFYCDKDLTEAHSAAADTRATYEVLLAQLERYDDLPADIEALSEYASQNRNVDLAGRLVYDDRKREIINFGKYKGKVAREFLRTEEGASYVDWIIKGDFPQNTKDAFMRLLVESRRNA